MFPFILCLLYTALAQMPVYPRTYLRGLKQFENESIQAEFINRGITYIEDAVFTAAKQGFTYYTTEPVDECKTYGPSELAPFGIDKAACENIVNGIRILVSERFPDSELLYDSSTKRYTLKW